LTTLGRPFEGIAEIRAFTRSPLIRIELRLFIVPLLLVMKNAAVSNDGLHIKIIYRGKPV
jgi:hypothetical protein